LINITDCCDSPYDDLVILGSFLVSSKKLMFSSLKNAVQPIEKQKE